MKLRHLLALPVAALAMLGPAAASTPAWADEGTNHSLTVVCNERGGCTEEGRTNGEPDPRVNLWENDRAYWLFRKERKLHAQQFKMARRNELLKARQMALSSGSQPATYSKEMAYGGGAPWFQQSNRGGDDINIGNVYNVNYFWVYIYQWGDNNQSNFVAQDNINTQAGLAAFNSNLGQNQNVDLVNTSESDQNTGAPAPNG